MCCQVDGCQREIYQPGLVRGHQPGRSWSVGLSASHQIRVSQLIINFKLHLEQKLCEMSACNVAE